MITTNILWTALLLISVFLITVNYSTEDIQADQASQSPQSALQSAQPGQSANPGQGGQGTQTGPSVSSDHTGYNLTGQAGKNLTGENITGK
jgi:hypothetical protein